MDVRGAAHFPVSARLDSGDWLKLAVKNGIFNLAKAGFSNPSFLPRNGFRFFLLGVIGNTADRIDSIAKGYLELERSFEMWLILGDRTFTLPKFHRLIEYSLTLAPKML